MLKDKLVKEEKFYFTLMSRFTQDGLENLFSIVRYKNPIPTLLEFKNALRVISLTQLLNAKTKKSYDTESCVELHINLNTSSGEIDETNVADMTNIAERGSFLTH